MTYVMQSCPQAERLSRPFWATATVAAAANRVMVFFILMDGNVGWLMVDQWVVVDGIPLICGGGDVVVGVREDVDVEEMFVESERKEGERRRAGGWFLTGFGARCGSKQELVTLGTRRSQLLLADEPRQTCRLVL